MMMASLAYDPILYKLIIGQIEVLWECGEI
jgi:hypothetical protein